MQQVPRDILHSYHEFIRSDLNAGGVMVKCGVGCKIWRSSNEYASPFSEDFFQWIQTFVFVRPDHFSVNSYIPESSCFYTEETIVGIEVNQRITYSTNVLPTLFQIDVIQLTT